MIVDLVIVFIAIINTLVRLLPIGLYMGTIISSLVFDDLRATWLFGGFMLNELISFAYKQAMGGEGKQECALLADPSNFYTLPSSITQTSGFFFGFIMANSYYENDFKSLKFIVMSVVLAITIFSRVNIGCENIITALTFASIGTAFGMIYYRLIKDYYKPSIEEVTVNNAFYD